MTEPRDRGGAASAAPPPADPDGPRLRDAIDREVDAIGRAWADSAIAAFRSEGRSITGGWPGTMSEARARVSGCGRGASRRAEPDREALARRAYVVAKATWLRRTAPDGDD
ncbi:MAG: hypothetical protein IT375_21640 [Polyangiaceae bacterium]|nr:hypothetical protein [Polyangiaceae bacterium]